MIITNDSQLQNMRTAGQAVAQVKQDMKAALRPGISTKQLDDIAGASFKRLRALSAPISVYDFPGQTCICVNEQAAHGVPGPRVIEYGDIVNLDVSADIEGWFSDTGESVVVGENEKHEKLAKCAKDMLYAGIELVKPGARLMDIGFAMQRVAEKAGNSVIKRLTGHGIGRTLHDEPRHIFSYGRVTDRRRLAEGMVISLESFVTTGSGRIMLGEDGWTMSTVDGEPAAQFEHTLVVTSSGPLILTELD
ncbi:MAG: type I methionyl aminopeptidase [Christensenellales bacterium]